MEAQEIQNIQIRAKKISELDNYDYTKDHDSSYVIIGYNDGTFKQNYKISLSQLSQLIGNNTDDETLIIKINNFISNNQITLPQTDLSGLQNQINELRNAINQYHKAYTINYTLANVSIANQNDYLVINQSDELILNCIPATGYKMPDNITVEGCSYVYDKNGKTIRLYNPTANVNVTIECVKVDYTLTVNLKNITYSFIEGYKSKYNYGDSVILSLVAEDGYELPDPFIFTHCLYNITDRTNTAATIVITCNGTGNMSISGEAISVAQYYFGFVSDLDNPAMNTSDISITYNYSDDNLITGISSFTLNSTDNLTMKTTCPFNIDTKIVVNGIGYGGNALMIVPKKYVSIGSLYTEFLYNNVAYNFHPYSLQFLIFPLSMYYEFSINGVPHYVIYMGGETIDGSEFIIK